MKYRMRCFWIAVAAVAALAAPVRADFNSLAASPNALFPNTATSVRFVADIAPDPKLLRTSVTLLRETNGVFATVATMRDDGTGGDQVANDNKFTAVLTLSAPAGGELHFRASAGYVGSLKRLQSSTLTVGVLDAVDLNISAGRGAITLLQGEKVSTAFTLAVSNQSGAAAHVTVSQSLVPPAGLGIVSDLPAGGFNTTQTQQTFLVQNSLTGTTPGNYTLTLNGTLTIGAQTVNASATTQVRVLPASGIGDLTLASYPGGLQANAANDVTFGAHYDAGVALPSSVDLIETTAAGVLIQTLGTLVDDGSAGDVASGDRIYTAVATLVGGVPGTIRYFRALGHFATGTGISPILALTSFPFPVQFSPVNTSSIVPDPTFGRSIACDQLIVRFKAGVSLQAIQTVVAGFGGTIIGVEGSINAYQIDIPCMSGPAIWALIDSLNDNPAVALASPNGVGEVSELKPNDSRYASQYSPALVRADEAWLIARGAGVVVAVLDTGVDYAHADLASRVTKGDDVVNGDTDPMDDHSHGTHVAGIIAANGNNGAGIAGMAWDASILAIKVCNAAGQCPDSAVVSGILAASTQAKIINMSLGGPKSLWESAKNLVGIKTAYQLAVEGASANGVLVVAAAGNANTSSTYVPCAYPTVLCVGNTTSADVRYADPTFGSNFGDQVDIAAPGTSILSTVPSFNDPSGYALKTGTSMAAPLVAGVAALVWANNPTWTRGEVEDRLLKTAKPLPGQEVGPRIDAFDAVFNGSFEHELSGWKVVGTGSAVNALGPISPTKDKIMGMVSTGPDAAVSESSMSQDFTIQAGVTELVLSFSYAMVTEEYPEWINRGFNDDLVIIVQKIGSNQQLAIETVDGSAFVPVTGIDFPGGDSTVGWTQWKSVTSLKVPIAQGPGTYRITVRDRGDGIYDTNGLLDNIRFK